MNHLEGGLDKVMALKPLTYQYRINEFPEMNFEDRTHYGFSASEIEEVIPELINQSFQPIDEPISDREVDRGTWFKAINYQEMIPVLTKAIQEQQEVIEALQTKVEQLETRLNE